MIIIQRDLIVSAMFLFTLCVKKNKFLELESSKLFKRAFDELIFKFSAPSIKLFFFDH